MLVVALDVGTSSARARCFDTRGQTVPGAEARVTYEPITTPDGGVELDAPALVDAVATALDGCVARCGDRAREIGAVGASVFWHSLLALDDAGAPLTRVITWADTRSAAAAAELRRALDERAVHARTGAPLHSTFFPAKLAWLRQSRPDVFSRARTWCGFAEYLHARLTGVCRASTSMASGTGLMEHERGGWDERLGDVCGIDAGRLPEIDDAPAAGLIAAYASRWPALARARWYPAHGDGACSNIGSDCTGPNRLALNVGTSAAMRLAAREGFGAHRPTPWGLWRYRVDRTRSLVGGATSEGGNVLAWCRRNLALPADDDELARAIDDIPPDGHGLTALPFLAGERSVGWRGDARAVLAGLSLDTRAPHVLRAMMESVAFRLALVYERLAPLAASDHAILASGGALMHSPAWLAIIADVLGVPVIPVRESEASARGAALLTLEAEGVHDPAPLALEEPCVPNLRHHAIYRRARERHQALYDNVVGPRPA